MVRPAIPDVITIVASAYFQPIADLLDKLLSRPIAKPGPAGVGEHENGYSAALVVLLIAVLESYTSRVRIMRKSEISGDMNTPALLSKLFPALPTKDELVEVCLVRNVVAHNHVWHLDVSDFHNAGAPTIANPRELGFKPNQNYDVVVDVTTRTTRLLRLNISPTSVDRTDVWKVFDVTWRTLKHMNATNFSDTPLGGSTVIFRGKRREFADLLQELKNGIADGSP